jgi:RNA polymerase sigma factor (sigma-70 family)
MAASEDIQNKLDSARKKLGSADWSVRQAGVGELCDALYNPTLRRLQRMGINYYDAEDILQDALTKLHKAILNKPLVVRYPRAYFYKIARSVLADWYNEMAKQRQLESKLIEAWDTSHVPDRPMEELFERKATKKLLFHIEDPIDRELALLRYKHGFKPDQIVSVIGKVEKSEVTNSLLRSERAVRNMAKEDGKYLNELTPLEKELAFTNDENPIGVSFVGISPQNFHPDLVPNILKDLGVKHLQQAGEEFAPFLRSEDYYSDDPGVRFSYVKREELKKTALQGVQGGKVTYVDYDLDFTRDKENGGNTIVLSNKHEYQAHVEERYFDEQAERLIDTWDFPTMGVSIRKPFYPQKLVQIDRFSITSFRIYPYDEWKN